MIHPIKVTATNLPKIENIIAHNCFNCEHCVPALPNFAPARLMCDIINISCGRLEPTTNNKCIFFKLKLQDDDTKRHTL